MPLDGSALSEATLPIVTELARRTGATIALLRAVEPYWETQLSWFGINHDDSTSTIEQTAARADQLLTDARAYLERIARGLRLIDVRATWEVRIGKAAAEITRAAETVSPDLVAMATHGRGGFHRWVVGSVTNEVLHRSNVPLLVVPAHLNRARERLEDEDRAPGWGVEGSSMRRAGAGGLSPPS